MKEKKPFVHLFYTYGGFYLYDVNKNTILKTNKKTFDSIKQNNFEEENIEKLKGLGFLSSNRIREIEHPANDNLKYILQSKVKMLTLQVTQQCNLRCKYCVYSGGYNNRSHSNKKLSFETAKKGIDFLFEHSYNSDQISIGFYGGEPLLELELIKKCIEYAEECSEGKDIAFTMTTNGTLLEKSVVEYLNCHNVSLVVSLDGPQNIHDKNRKYAKENSGSFDTIIKNIEEIKRYLPEYSKKILLSTVIDPQNDFGCISEFFAKSDTVKDFAIIPTLITENYSKHENETSDNFIIRYGYEIFKIMLSKLGRLNRKYTSIIVDGYYFQLKNKLFKNKLSRTDSLSEKGHPGGPCVIGGNRLFMDINGFLYPCERVSESSSVMRIGHIDSGFNVEKCLELMNVGKITEEECKNCWAFRFCTSCCAKADNLAELSAEKRLSHCQGIKSNVELLLKDYCTLTEFGCYFDENINNFEFEIL